MRSKATCLIFLIALAMLASSCGTTVYSSKVYKSPKYIGYKKHWWYWHAHHYRPRAHYGGYW